MVEIHADIFGRETGKKTQFACLIFHWITCSFWFENSVGMLDLCANVSCLESWKNFQFACVIFLIDNMLFCRRNGSNAC